MLSFTLEKQMIPCIEDVKQKSYANEKQILELKQVLKTITKAKYPNEHAYFNRHLKTARAYRKDLANYRLRYKFTHKRSRFSVVHTYTRELPLQGGSSVNTRLLLDGWRADLRSFRFRLKPFRHDHRALIGGVHDKPGEILMKQKNKILDSYFKTKSPGSSSPTHVGVELEFVSSFTARDLAKFMHKRYKCLHKYVQFKSDASITVSDEENEIGIEINICAPADIIKQTVSQVCEVLHERGCYVNHSCGMHVHLDLRHRDRNKALTNLVKCQSLLYKMVPDSRRKGRWAKPIRSASWNTYRDSRYHGINTDAYRKFRTIEIRIHSATITASKVNNWIAILEAIVDAPTTFTQRIATLKRFQAVTDLPTYILTYMRERMRKFKPKKVVNQIVENGCSISDDQSAERGRIALERAVRYGNMNSVARTIVSADDLLPRVSVGSSD